MLYHTCHRSKTERNSFQQSVMGPSTVPWPRPMKVSGSAGYIPQTSSLDKPVRISHGRKDDSRIVCHEKIQTRQGPRISRVGVRLHVHDQRLDRTLWLVDSATLRWVWCGGSQNRVAHAMLLKRLLGAEALLVPALLCIARCLCIGWLLGCAWCPGGETPTLCTHQSFATCRSSWAVRWRSSFSERGTLRREGNKFYSVHSARWETLRPWVHQCSCNCTLGLQSTSRAHALEFLLVPENAGVTFEAQNFQWVKMMVWAHLIRSQVSMLASEATLVSWVEELGAVGDWYQGAQQPLRSFWFLGQLHSWPSRLMG